MYLSVHPLSLGYYAVVNRGQRDIDNNVCIRDALSKELNFFETNGENYDFFICVFQLLIFFF
jgi:hypothetical protein